MELNSVLFVSLVCYLLIYVTDGRVCLKNEGIGEREGNTYFCRDEQECCEQSGSFTCCESNHTRNIRQQLQLWGIVAALLFLIFIVYARTTGEVKFFEKPTLSESLKNVFSSHNKDSTK